VFAIGFLLLGTPLTAHRADLGQEFVSASTEEATTAFYTMGVKSKGGTQEVYILHAMALPAMKAMPRFRVRAFTSWHTWVPVFSFVGSRDTCLQVRHLEFFDGSAHVT